ncbi:MAG: hypothetical protein A2Y64_09195 [Candidatus Coatesbacteria bacterium RBG_13_66_14]|uniref:Uncharacterized protein n=1 Tax=Candidatus Coatesbacteria bacterium RBG_13_66_14 TaxID=1817816 RepID=A0A1F5F6V5_9BACT|nr:MAG: hypothetical protein A2Y64_09195 [Candidatus Coatesbacteria bacterium RBG_13_66_14]
MADEYTKNPPYAALIVISIILTLGFIVLAFLGGGPIVFFIGLLFAILAFIFWGKMPRRVEPAKSAAGLRTVGAIAALIVGLAAIADGFLAFVGLGLALDIAVFAFTLLLAWFLFPGLRGKVPRPLSLVIGILLALGTLMGLLGYLMPESFIYVALFFAGCAVIAVAANLVYSLMGKSEAAATIGGWLMAIVMTGIFVFIFIGGEIVQLAVNLEVEQKLEPKIVSVEGGAAAETTALDLKSFGGEEVVLRPGDTDAAVSDAAGIEVGYDVLIGSVTDSSGNVYPSPHAERVTVTSVDPATKTFSWDPKQPLVNYHLTGEYVIKSRTNIFGIIGIIITLLILFAGKVRLPEVIRNAFGWFLGFAFLAAFVYLAVILILEGSQYSIILGIGALLAPGIAIFAWLRDRAAARKLNL